MTEGDFVNLKVSSSAKVAGDTTTKTLAVGDPGPIQGTVQTVYFKTRSDPTAAFWWWI
jgi:hypothetical protein